MCYHTALVAQPHQLALRFGREFDRIEDFRPTYHVSAFAHTEYPIITVDPHIQFFRWGLIPFWTDTLEDAIANPQPHDKRPVGNDLLEAFVPGADPQKAMFGSGFRILRLAA